MRRRVLPRGRMIFAGQEGAHHWRAALGLRAGAAYAESAAPAFPAVGTTKPGTPRDRARVTAARIPRALNEPGGFSPSSLTHRRRTPIALARWGASCIGVRPSPNDTGCSP